MERLRVLPTLFVIVRATLRGWTFQRRREPVLFVGAEAEAPDRILIGSENSVLPKKQRFR